MESIEKKVQETLILNSDNFDDPKTRELEKAMLEFKDLVKKGIAKERGYNLESINRSHIKHIGFNTFKK